MSQDQIIAQIEGGPMAGKTFKLLRNVEIPKFIISDWDGAYKLHEPDPDVGVVYRFDQGDETMALLRAWEA